MKEIKPGCYLSMSGMVAELNAKTPTKPKIIDLHSDGFDIRFDYDSFFEENEILRGPTPIESPFTTNMERYTALYVYRDFIQNLLVGDVRAPLLRVVPVKSRYGDTTCVTYEQPQFLPLSRSIIQTMEINIRSDTDELVSFESEKSIVTLAFRRNFTNALITSI